MSLWRFVQRHPRLARLPFVRDWVSRRVWSALDTPEFRDELRRAREDFAAGRTYIFDTETGVISPNPEWPDDGPPPLPPRDFVTGEPA